MQPSQLSGWPTSLLLGRREIYQQAIELLPMVAPLHTNLAAALAQLDGGAGGLEVDADGFYDLLIARLARLPAGG